MQFLQKASRLLLFFCIFYAEIAAQTSNNFKNKANFTGYIKDLRTAYLFDGLKNISIENRWHNRLQFNYPIHPNLTFDVEIRNQLVYGDFVRNINQLLGSFSQNSYGSQLKSSNNLLKLNFLLFNNDSGLLLSQVDRFWLKWQKEKWEIKLGKQRINWGNNFIWNANDLFNTQSFLDFDYQERPGVDALRISFYPHFSKRFEWVLAPQKTIQTSTFAALYQFNKHRYDFQTIVAYYQNQLALGLGWAGNIKNLGFKGEATYFEPLTNDGKGNFVASMGIDYSLPSGWFFQTEILYNGYGNNSLDYASALVSTQNLSPQNIWFGRTAWACVANYGISPRLNFTGSFILNPADFSPKNMSCFIVPAMQITLSDDFDFLIQAQLNLPTKLSIINPQAFGLNGLDKEQIIGILGLENNVIATSNQLFGNVSTRIRWSF